MSNKLLNELTTLINKHSLENGSSTPDFLLAEYLLKCLEVFEKTSRDRDRWYGIKPLFPHEASTSE